MSDQRFFSTGLPQLPLNTDPRIEQDLRDLYAAIKNLNYLVGQYVGFEIPVDAYQNVDGVEYTAGYYKRRLYCEATEAIPYGGLVNLYNDAGTLKARFANATNFTRPCYGIKNDTGTNAIGDTIEVALPGCYVTSIGGMTPGTRYFLSTVNGVMNTAEPAAVGNIKQAIGFSFDATRFFFLPNIHWTVV